MIFHTHGTEVDIQCKQNVYASNTAEMKSVWDIARWAGGGSVVYSQAQTLFLGETQTSESMTKE